MLEIERVVLWIRLLWAVFGRSALLRKSRINGLRRREMKGDKERDVTRLSEISGDGQPHQKKCPCLHLFVPRQNQGLAQPRYHSIHRIFRLLSHAFKLVGIDNGTTREYTA